MPFDSRLARVYSERSVRQHAPSASGVIGLSNSSGWLYIADTDDIRMALLDLLEDQPRGPSNRSATGFSFELSPLNERAERRAELVRELQPAKTAG